MSDLETLRSVVRTREGAVPRMLPAAAYTSEEVLAWERRHLFAGTWTCLGRLEELLPEGVTQRAAVVGDVPVLLVRSARRCAPSPTPAATAATSCCPRVRRPLVPR